MAILALLLVFLPAVAQAAGKLEVVATTPDLGAVARTVGRDDVDVTALARPTEDPHFVDAKPSFIRVLNRADVLIEGGASLEAGWLPPLLDSARNPRLAMGAPGRVIAAQGLQLRDVPATLDRALGDVHPQGNPHFLLDPVAAKTVARTIASAFCAVDGGRCADYEAGVRRFEEAVDTRLPAWEAALAPLKGSKVVTYHKDFDYFLERFGIGLAGTLEPKPGIPPSPTHLTELIPRMRTEHVRLIVVEPYRERNNPDFVAQNTGARVVVVPAMPETTGESAYVDLIDADVRRLADAVRGGS